ncbi:MAG: hypothetical protein GX130_13860, partial [Candidatus Hydrogenedens sp.]|nr:hypothetical protein [Candidatus Hydrogenedens sp.]
MKTKGFFSHILILLLLLGSPAKLSASYVLPGISLHLSGATKSIEGEVESEGIVPGEMIDVVAGTFPMGGVTIDPDSSEEIWPQPVYLDEYKIGKYPVTNREYL